jgi:hypothetical protein
LPWHIAQAIQARGAVTMHCTMNEEESRQWREEQDRARPSLGLRVAANFLAFLMMILALTLLFADW